MQNSARCVLPVTSMSRLRKSRSTSHGGTKGGAGDPPATRGDPPSGEEKVFPCGWNTIPPGGSPGGTGQWPVLPRSNCLSSSLNAISSSYNESLRASSTRGCWLVGPINSPLNRNDSDG